MAQNKIAPDPDKVIEVPIRVRYCECDPMNVAHHSSYAVWLEIARTDMLRRDGTSYAKLEEAGTYFVVARLSIRYRKPARYDDDLTVRCWIDTCSGAKLDHAYEIMRGKDLIATAETTLVCVNKHGNIQPIPSGAVS
ncbi:MAG: acyl-CoA thioesterase [Phycisphaeraceae bacterium JB051]